MKGLLFVLLVGLFLGVAQAQDTVFVIMAPPPTSTETTTPPPTQIQVIEIQTASPLVGQPVKQKRSRKSSFYLNGGLGPDFSYIYYNHRYYDSKTKYDGTGYGAAGELSLGVLIKELIAVHGTFEFSTISGKYDLDNATRESPVRSGRYYQSNSNVSEFYDDDFDAVTVVGGVGFTIFPWLFRKPDSFMGGAFIGGNLLMGIIVLDQPDYFDVRDNSSSKDYFAFGFDLEIGKDWKISERTSLGVALKWHFIGIGSGDDMAGEDDYEDYYHHNHQLNAFQLLFRINRK